MNKVQTQEKQIPDTIQKSKTHRGYRIRRAVGAGAMAVGGLTGFAGLIVSGSANGDALELSQDLEHAATKGVVGENVGGEDSYNYQEHTLNNEDLHNFADDAKDVGSSARNGVNMVMAGALIGIAGAALNDINEEKHKRSLPPQDVKPQ